MTTLSIVGAILMIPFGMAGILAFYWMGKEAVKNVRKEGIFSKSGLFYVSAFLALVGVVLLTMGTK